MSINSLICPECHGRGYVEKQFLEMADVTWKDLEERPELALKNCPLCNAEGRRSWTLMRVVEDAEEIPFVTNPALLKGATDEPQE